MPTPNLRWTMCTLVSMSTGFFMTRPSIKGGMTPRTVVLGREEVVTMPKVAVKLKRRRLKEPPCHVEVTATSVSVLGERILEREGPSWFNTRHYGAETKTYDMHTAFVESDHMSGGAFVSFELPRKESRFDVKLGTTSATTLALSRIKRWWSAPAFQRSVPLETQFLLLKQRDLFVLVLPLLSDDGRFRCTLWDAANTVEKRMLRARCESGDDNARTEAMDGALWIGGVKSDDASAVYGLIDRGLEAVARRKNFQFRPLKYKGAPEKSHVVQGLGWCTWDACYSAVDATQIDLGLRAIKKKTGVTVQRLIVDDGWMQLDREPPKIATTIHDEGSALMSGQTLTGLSVSENVATHLYDKDDERPAKEAPEYESIFARMFKLAFLSMQKSIATCLGHVYAKYVETAPDDSIAVALWRFAASTPPLRGALVHFFDENTDFTRRLEWPPKPHEEKFGGIDGFAKFLKQVARSEHGVKFVATWHAIGGHWGGIDAPEVETVRSKATPHLQFVEPSIAWDPASLKGMTTPTAAAGISAMYDRLYAVLARCGVDGVKADAQSGVGALGHHKGGGPASVKLFVNAMEQAAAKYFPAASSEKGVAVTNCMCHSTENLYQYAETMYARASDDFYPRDPSSWLYHITACAYNSIFLGGIMWPDWDMFQSKHPAAWTHAAARAVSGSPVTLSDEPGAHDPSVVRALALPSGATLVSKAPGRVAADCLFHDVTKDTPLKIVSPANDIGTAVVGIFHLQGSTWSRTQRRYVKTTDDASDRPLRGSLRPRDALPAFQHELLTRNDQGQRSADAALEMSAAPFVACSFARAPERRKIIDFRELDQYDFDLAKPGDFQVFTLARLRPVRPGSSRSWAPLGLIDMLNAGAAVVDVGWDTYGGFHTVLVQGPGRFAFFADDRPSRVTGFADDDIHYDGRLLTVRLHEDRLHRLNFSWD